MTKLTLWTPFTSMSATHLAACSSSLWYSDSGGSKPHILRHSSLYCLERSMRSLVLSSPYFSTRLRLHLPRPSLEEVGKWEWKSITFSP